MMSYGFGQVGEALVTAGIGTFLVYYYNQVLMVSGTITGTVLMLTLLVDALIDPAAGALSDRMRSKYGRRHPFILAAAVPFGAFFYLMFNPPAGLGEMELAVWLFAFTLLTRISQSFYSVPHLALGAEMAHDYNQRSQLYSFNVFFSTIGGAVGTALAYRFFFPTTPEYSPGLLNPHGYNGFAMAFGVGIVGALLICAAGTWREIPHMAIARKQAAKFSVAQVLRETGDAFGNRSFRAVFFGMALATVMLAMEGVLAPYMGVHFWGLTTEQLSTLPLAAVLGLFTGVVVMPAVTRWLDKKKTLMYCSYLSLVVGNVLIILRLLDVPWFPANGSPWILPMLLVVTYIATVLSPLVFGSLNAMFADIVDEHELEIGHRREGIIFAARAFLIKLVSALGTFLGGVLIDVIEFPRGAPAGTVDADVLWNLGLFQSPLPSILVFVAVMMYSGYRLDRQRHAEILRELAARRAAIDESSAG